jgi:ABC-type multidrug transport system ATPase subunit
VLEARAISKHFGGQCVLRGVDLMVAPREVVGLVGMNGSGKTTLLDMLSGKVRPDAGEIWLDGKRIVPGFAFAKRPPLFRSYQVPRLFYGLSVAENLLLGRWGPGTSCGPTDAGIDGLSRGNPANTLSIGQRRRVILDWIRARIGRAKYLLLDEPASGADDVLVGLLEDLLDSARKQGCGVLLVEHRDGVLKSTCDRIVYLRDGVCFDDAGPNGKDGGSRPTACADHFAKVTLAAPLNLHNLAVARDGALVMSGINLRLNPGEAVVLTGPNGCGKSTLLRAIYGDPACSVVRGAITSEGHDLVVLGLQERMSRGIHLMPQDGALFPSMSVEEALRTSVEAAGAHNWNAQAVKDVRRELPILDKIWRRRCGLLSGGERRIVSLARILLIRPRVALLDEPLAGVDIAGRPRVAQLVGQLASEGAAVLVAEQQGLASGLPATQSVYLKAPPSVGSHCEVR